MPLNNIMDYKNKYLKYKKKYNSIKQNIQKGGYYTYLVRIESDIVPNMKF